MKALSQEGTDMEAQSELGRIAGLIAAAVLALGYVLVIRSAIVRRRREDADTHVNTDNHADTELGMSTHAQLEIDHAHDTAIWEVLFDDG